MPSNLQSALALGICLAVGLIGGGSFIKSAAEIWQQSSRFVTVRGLAERDIAADLALWPFNYGVTANALDDLQQALVRDGARIRAFLEARGFDPAHVTVAPPRITDQFANLYGSQRPDERYRAEATILLRTPDVDGVLRAMPEVSELVRGGVLLSPSYEFRTEFLFTALDAVKPDMIAAATADARNAAQQFAEDAGSRVGRIRNATQGYFSISDLDSYTPSIKRVRVVTTIEYVLED